MRISHRWGFAKHVLQMPQECFYIIATPDIAWSTSNKKARQANWRRICIYTCARAGASYSTKRLAKNVAAGCDGSRLQRLQLQMYPKRWRHVYKYVCQSFPRSLRLQLQPIHEAIDAVPMSPMCRQRKCPQLLQACALEHRRQQPQLDHCRLSRL